MLQLFQRLDDVRERGALNGCELLDLGTATLEQFTDAGLNVLGSNTREGREGLLAQ